MRRVRRGFWIVLAYAVTGVFTILLLVMGEKGAEISQTLSLAVTIIAFLIDLYCRETTCTAGKQRHRFLLSSGGGIGCRWRYRWSESEVGRQLRHPCDARGHSDIRRQADGHDGEDRALRRGGPPAAERGETSDRGTDGRPFARPVMRRGAEGQGSEPVRLARERSGGSVRSKGHGGRFPLSDRCLYVRLAAATTVPFPKDVLYIGVTSDHPGFSTFESGTSRRAGFDVDLARWLGERLGKTVRFVDVSLQERVDVLKKSPPEVDMVVSTFSITDERREEVDFAGPYMIARQGAMVRKDDDPIDDFDDLTRGDRNVCVPDDTTSEKRLEIYNGKTMILTKEAAQRFFLQRLIEGQVDAFSTDRLILHGFAKGKSELRVTDVTFGAQEQYGVGLPNDDRAKCEEITRLLEEFVNTGEWDKVFDRYFDLEERQSFKPFRLDPCEPTERCPPSSISVH